MIIDFCFMYSNKTIGTPTENVYHTLTAILYVQKQYLRDGHLLLFFRYVLTRRYMYVNIVGARTFFPVVDRDRRTFRVDGSAAGLQGIR